jgi:uncharacterized membrane protein
MENIEPTTNQKHAKSIGKTLLNVSIYIFGIISLYYLIFRGFPFLIVSEEIYGPYYFSRAVWIWPHVVGGVVAMAIGPFQFIPKIRIKYPKFHRITGYIYLIGILISALTLAFLVTTSSSGLIIDIGLGLGGIVWLVTAIFAFWAIKNGKIKQHQEWMVRCYMITLAFVVFRIAVDMFTHYQVTDEAEIVAISAWLSWTLPLAITEFILQGQKIMK